MSGASGLVARIQTFPLEHRLADGRYGTAKVRPAARVATLVKVTTDGGAVGWGEASGPPRLVTPAIEEIGRTVVGTPVSLRAARWLDRLDRGYHLGAAGGHVSAISGLDLAMWDAQARELGVPVSALLGGAVRHETAAYASTGYYQVRHNEARLRDYLAQAVGEGFTAAKIKIGGGVAEDVARTAIAREALGAGGQVIVDYNANGTLGTALASLRAIASLVPLFAEEPLPPTDAVGWAALRHAGIPLAAGEALYTRFGFRDPIAERRIDIAQPNLSTCGGFTEAAAIAAMAAANNVRVMPHVWGTGVLLAATLQFIATLPDAPFGERNSYPTMLEYDLGENPLRYGVLDAPITATAGKVAIPATPGIGVTVAEDDLHRWTIKGLGLDVT